MLDAITGVMVGLVLGLIICMTLIKTDRVLSLESELHQSLKACEMKLPRTQECVLVAVPDVR